MIIVYVKHYLNNDGITYFDETWFPKVRNIIQNQPGFVAIESHKDAIASSCVHITVKFANIAFLEAWVKTAEHNEVINLLDPYRTKAWEVASTNDESKKPATLIWEKIESKHE